MVGISSEVLFHGDMGYPNFIERVTHDHIADLLIKARNVLPGMETVAVDGVPLF